MADSELALTLSGEEMIAFADRALSWTRAGTLFVADVHFGKDSSFRHAGRWVPHGTTENDLTRLTRLLERTRARRLVILGDAFHSEHAREDSTFLLLREWRSQRVDLEIFLVKGNHDRRAGQIARDLDFQPLEEGHRMAPFILRHHPAVEPPEGYVLRGHVHPVVLLRGPARQRARVPCFWAGARECVLPAFGGFTGGSVVRPISGDRVILVLEDEAGNKLRSFIAPKG